MFEEAITTLVPLRRSLRERERELGVVLQGKDIDPAALEAALASMRKTSEAYQREMHRLALQVLPTLTPKERRMVMHQLMPDRGRPPQTSASKRASAVNKVSGSVMNHVTSAHGTASGHA